MRSITTHVRVIAAVIASMPFVAYAQPAYFLTGKEVQKPPVMSIFPVEDLLTGPTKSSVAILLALIFGVSLVALVMGLFHHIEAKNKKERVRAQSMLLHGVVGTLLTLCIYAVFFTA